MSTTGVPSIASSGPTRNRKPSLSKILTRCRPIGLGLSGDRVPNTPVNGLFMSLPGCTFITVRRARCSHVSKITSSPTATRSKHFANRGAISNHASGAPKYPCRGAFFRFFRSERISPTGSSKYCFVSFIPQPPKCIVAFRGFCVLSPAGKSVLDRRLLKHPLSRIAGCLVLA